MAKDLNQIIKVGDYLRVEQKVVCYEAGEIAHIENVMIGETRERKNTYLEREERITESESILENEQERDTQTSERYSMQRESQKILSQEMNFDVSLSVSGQAGPVTIAANTGFSMGQSTQQMDKVASEYVKSVVERARNRTFQRTRNYEKLTIIKQWEDINSHSFKNEPSAGEDKSNNIGIYRWVDKKYENKLMNYGKRLMLNLMIPDPAAWHRLAATFTPTDGGLALPVDPADNGISSPNDITEVNYTQLAGRYNAQVKQVPDLYMSVSRPYSYATSEVYDNVLNTYGVKATKPTETLASKDDAIAIVDGYILDRIAVGIRYFTRYSNSGNVFVKVENKEFSSQGWNFEDELWTDFKRSSIPVSIFTHGFVDSYIVNVLIRLKRTNEVYRSWQLDTYNAIIEAYKRQLSEYRRKLDELKDNAKLYGNNPIKNRIIEQQELKKGAIAVLNDNGHYFNDFHETYKSSGYPVINVYDLNQPAEKVNFFEQSIDWDLMSYKFYPYFWQTDNSPMTATTGRWSKVYSIRDNDDTFEKFLQAGYAQVIVPVKPGCELQVLNFLEYGVMLNQNFVSKVPVVDLAKKEFLATNTPTFSSPRQVEKWFTKAPTNLVILQTSAQGAPGVGLPCWESNDKRLNPDLITLDEQFGTGG